MSGHVTVAQNVVRDGYMVVLMVMIFIEEENASS